MTNQSTASSGKISRDDAMVFYIVCGFFLLCFFRLLTIGYFRPDDLARTLTGYYDWSDDGRPLTTLVIRLLAFDFSNFFSPKSLGDDAPLPQFLAIGLMGLCGTFIHRSFTTIQPRQAAGAAILLFATPFMLEPMSYIFDSLGIVTSMTLGLCGALVIIREPMRRFNIIYSVLLLLSSLMFYQTGLNIYLAFASGYVLLQLASNHSGAPTTAGKFFIATIVAVGFYLFAISLLRRSGLIVFHEYQINHSQILEPGKILEGTVGNLTAMARYVASITGIRSLYALLMAIVVIRLGWRAIYNSTRKLGHFIVAVISLGCLCASFTGPILFLSNPIFAPRVFCGVGGMTAAAWLFGTLSAQGSNSQRASIFVAIGLMICFARYSFVYGAMARDFDRYETFICPNIAEQINALADATGAKSLAIFGSLPYPASIRHSYEAFPGMRPIPINQTGIDAFTQVLLLRYGLTPSLTLIKERHHDTCRPSYRSQNGIYMWHEKMTIFLVFDNAC